MTSDNSLISVPLNEDQERFLRDAADQYENWLPTQRVVNQYGYWLGWREKNGTDYLTRSAGAGLNQQSLGAKSPETQALYDDYIATKAPAKEEKRKIEQRIKDRSRLLKAARLGRLPATYGKLIREIDAGELLGTNVLVIGTFALNAYEVLARRLVDKSLLDAGNIELLIRLPEATDNDISGPLLDSALSSDKSYILTKSKPYRMKNSKGLAVEFITDELSRLSYLKSNPGKDIIKPLCREGAEWLSCAEPVQAVVIDSAGWPVRLVVPDPRVFALYAAWSSQVVEGEANSLNIAKQVAALSQFDIESYSFDKEFLKTLPQELKLVHKEIIAHELKVVLR